MHNIIEAQVFYYCCVFLISQPIPDNIFIVAACNPHRGNSLATHEKSRASWLSSSYQVRQLHPTLEFLKWDYGSLHGPQESDYVSAKMSMLENRMRKAEVHSLTKLIVGSQEQMRLYAQEQLDKCKVDNPELCARSCVSQRDIQRVFTFYQKLVEIYDHFKPHGEHQDYKRRAVAVALGIVYYMRLSSDYRSKYEVFLDEKRLLGSQVSFSQAFQDDLNWFMEQFLLPGGVAKTRTLKENLFAIVMCTMTHTPLIITGAPGSSKTLSFNLAVANLRGQESKSKVFSHTNVFRNLEPHIYQCSRRTTSSEIEKVFLQAVTRQKSRTKASLPVYCVVFMDEAGLPREKHQALKVLHSRLDNPDVSFVAITNTILDAAKTNRAVSLYIPDKQTGDLETLVRGCLNVPNGSTGVEPIANFSAAYVEAMEHDQYKNFFGLRDFIHFVTFLRRRIFDHGDMFTDKLVLQALERNFNGSDEPHKLWDIFLSKVCSHVFYCQLQHNSHSCPLL